jgi:hypothetical protein
MAFAPGLNSQILDYPEKDSGYFAPPAVTKEKKSLITLTPVDGEADPSLERENAFRVVAELPKQQLTF